MKLDLENDYREAVEKIKEKTKNIFPIEKGNKILELKNIIVKEEGINKNIPLQAQVKREKKSITTDVIGEFQLKNKDTGEIIDKSKIKLFDLPIMTPRGTFILGGNEYNVINQLRLKPGVYNRVADDGTIQSEFNLTKGKNFKIILEPNTKLFKVNIAGTHLNLYSILKGLNIPDEKIQEKWGAELLKINKEKSKNIENDFLKFQNKFSFRKESDFEIARQKIIEEFNNPIMDPVVNNETIGLKTDKISSDTFLNATEKLLKISKNESEPDDRDSLYFKSIHSFSDFMDNHLDYRGRQLKREISNKMNYKDKIQNIVSKPKFKKAVDSFFYSTSLASTPEQNNPLDMYNEINKVTVLGEGGISDMRGVPVNVRNLNPSQFGFIDSIHTPESEKIGIVTHLTEGVKKKGNELVFPLINKKTGKIEELNSLQIKNSVVAFPNEFEKKGDKWIAIDNDIKALKNNETVNVKPNEVDYIIEDARDLFALSSNMIPFLANDQGARAMMAGKQLGAALSLVNREEPLVQKETKNKISFEKDFGKTQSVFSDVNGIVENIKDDGTIIIKTDNGQKKEFFTYKNFPLNQNQFIDSEYKVKQGDKVKKGQLLADNNYTKNGTLALGTNLITAYVPYEGKTFEDGFVISETASKKLTSQEMTKYSIPKNEKTILDIKKFNAQFPGHIKTTDMSNLDERGIIKKGTKLKTDMPVYAYLTIKQINKTDENFRSLHKTLMNPYAKKLERWEGNEGEVFDVAENPNEIIIYIKTFNPAKIGDKITGSHGNKGIISDIKPDSEMPKTEDGIIPDVIFNPLGIPSRINVGQVYENIVGQIATKQGKPISITNFKNVDSWKEIKKMVDKAGIKTEKKLIDPNLGETEKAVTVGPQYFYKLKQTVENKSGSRNYEGGYDADLRPSRGGHGEDAGGQSMDHLTLYGMLSHGALNNLKEFSVIKSEKNDEFWRNLISGQKLPAPKTTYAYDKFVQNLKLLGTDVKKDGNKLKLIPFLDKDVDKISNGEIKNASFVLAKNLNEEENGLFDKKITGGLSGNKWSHIELSNSIPNPVFEKAIALLLNIKESEIEEIISGIKFYDANSGKLTTKKEGNVFSGSRALKKMLSDVNLTVKEKELKNKSKNASLEELDKINMQLKFIKNIKNNNLKLEDFLIKKIPVLPPAFRSIYEQDDGTLITSDLNLLYKNLILTNNQLKNKIPDEELKNKLSLELYKNVKNLQGIEEKKDFGKQELRGVLPFLAGKPGEGPKSGFVQGKLISKRQNLTARSTIIGDANLAVDEIGIPENIAWNIFKPFAIKEMVSGGFTPLQAKKEFEDKTKTAQKVLDKIMEEKKVWANRAPSLHRYSVMAFKPKLVEGKAIHFPNLTMKPMGADVDGDSIALHVPVSKAANDEAANFTARELLIHPLKIDSNILSFEGEALAGLYLHTQTEQGRKMINDILPDKYDLKGPVTKKTLKDIIYRISSENKSEAADVLSKLHKLGNGLVFQKGLSLTFDDVKPIYEKNKIFNFSPKNAAEIFKLNKPVSDILQNDINNNKNNNLYIMHQSGAKGSKSQVQQMKLAPVMVEDYKGKPIPVLIKNSFSQGLKPAEYMAHMFGARKGMLDRKLATADPGAVSKETISAMMEETVTIQDCKTKNGIFMNIDDPNALGRYTAEVVGHLPANEHIDPKDIRELKKNPNIKRIKVRSPQTCEAKDGVCQYCYGDHEQGNLASIGDNVGSFASQTMLEPFSQSQMRTFHEGGLATDKQKKSTFTQPEPYARLKQILAVPKTLPDKATLATLDGTITDIKDSPIGGKDIIINGETHYAPARLPIIVKKGDRVVRGQQLTGGLVDHRELGELTNIETAREKIKEDLLDIFNPLAVKSKAVELLAKKMTNLAKIQDSENPNFTPGDYVPYSVIKKELDNGDEVPIEKALGKNIAEDFKELGIYKNDIIDIKKINKLKNAGFKNIKVLSKNFSFTPQIKGFNMLANYNPDWMAKMNFRYLKRNLLSSIQKSEESNIHGSHPIPAYIYGKEFGDENKY